MITRKRYSQEFKKKIAHELLMGISTAAEISKREGITSTTLYKWRDIFSVGDYDTDEQETAELKKRIKDLEETVSDLALENHILKKTEKILKQLRKKRKIIREYLAPEFGVVKSCKAMGLSISTYYYRKFEKDTDDMMIAKEIEDYIELVPESGYRPVTVYLNRQMLINHKKVNRIMREKNLLCRKKKKFRTKTTDSSHNLKKYKNLIKNFETTDINQLVVGDVTAYDVRGKDHFLATLMDRHNREIIGEAVSDRNNTELVLAALEDAIQNRGNLNLKNCIHHTDSDVRYCSVAYIKRLKLLEMKISMCVGNAYENAHAESFNSTVKRQEINISDYDNKEESADSIFNFIDKYNSIRPHSSIENLTPVEYRKKLEKSQFMH